MQLRNRAGPLVRRREMFALAAALLPAAALLFGAGVWVGGRSAGERRQALPQSAETRAVYSPKVLSDPYFLKRQRENVAALEDACARQGEMCAEARAARGWLEEHGG